MFAALNLDRGNISNATSDNMLDDLNLTQGDYVSNLVRGVARKLMAESRYHAVKSWLLARRATLAAYLEAVRHTFPLVCAEPDQQTRSRSLDPDANLYL